MVDGVLLLVDAVEGPMPQTRFVTRKALALGLKAIVVVNKIDRPGARPGWVVDQTFDLFDKLGATDEQLDFPVIYASALQGWASLDATQQQPDMTPLFEAVLKYVPEPKADAEGPLQMQISTLDYNSYVGRIGIGRIRRGTVKPGMNVVMREGDEGPGHGQDRAGAGIPGPGARTGRHRQRRRHRRHHRPARCEHRHHGLRSGEPGGPAADFRRRTHAGR